MCDVIAFYLTFCLLNFHQYPNGKLGCKSVKRQWHSAFPLLDSCVNGVLLWFYLKTIQLWQFCSWVSLCWKFMCLKPSLYRLLSVTGWWSFIRGAINSFLLRYSTPQQIDFVILMKAQCRMKRALCLYYLYYRVFYIACVCVCVPGANFTDWDKLYPQHESVIIYPVKRGMTLLIHLQTSTAQPLVFGNGYVFVTLLTYGFNYCT